MAEEEEFVRAREPVSAADSYFIVDESPGGEVLHPTPICVSGWANRSIRGPAICAALARETERRASEDVGGGFVPVRFTADLYRPVMMLPLTFSSTAVRVGRRIAVIGATMHQGGRPVAQSTTLLAFESQEPDGAIWSQGETGLDFPATELLRDRRASLFVMMQGRSVPLSDAPSTSDRHTAWMLANDVVRGERISPFQFAAAAADASNLVSHWGELGIGYINADVTLNLTRLPHNLECGLLAVSRFAQRGISQGISHLYDRRGIFGTVSLVGLAADQPGDPTTPARGDAAAAREG